MKEFFETYEHLKQYPEFDLEEIQDKYKTWEESGSDGDGEWIYPPWIFDPKLAFEYVMLAYAPDSSLVNIKDQTVRKQTAMKDSKIPKEHQKKILSNEHPMIGDMITRLFTHVNDLDYELLISGKEAIVSLLEVVRKPVDGRLLDDKERNAIKAKKECFEDAQFLLKEVRSIWNTMHEINPDMAEYVKEGVFKGGKAESFSKKKRKS